MITYMHLMANTMDIFNEALKIVSNFETIFISTMNKSRAHIGDEPFRQLAEFSC